MRTAYSCLVDAGPKFEWQAVNLCTSILTNIGATPSDIKVHVTSRVSTEFANFVLDRGHCLLEVQPFPGDHGYCNKIQQLGSGAFAGYDRVVLCDCDLFFLTKPPLGSQIAAVAGRVVDQPNPPLDLLMKLYESRGITPRETCLVGFPTSADDLTIASNWNGGLYVLGTDCLEDCERVWARHALSLLADLDGLGNYRNHVDQIAWSLTLEELGLSYELLSSDANFPIHLGPLLADQEPAFLSSIHYHDRMDSMGKLACTGNARIDMFIGLANDQIAALITKRVLNDDDLLRLFQRWQAYCSRGANFDSVELAFHNARYLRHNSRRLEHLASLHLDLECKTVIEFGAGAGDNSLFFLDRNCAVTSLEPRSENVLYMLGRQTREPEYFRKDAHRIVQCSIEQAEEIAGSAGFQVVYNYGLLYHVAEPEAVLRATTRLCAGIYLLETAVSDLIDGPTDYVENADDLTNAIGGACRLLSRRRIFEVLGECMPHIYVPMTQPAHEQFLRDWTRQPAKPQGRHRAIFVASVDPLDNPMLVAELIDRHD